MCLYLTEKNKLVAPKPCVATKPIRCFKVVRKIYEKNSETGEISVRYVGPIYTDFEYRIGETVKTEEKIYAVSNFENKNDSKLQQNSFLWSVNKGLHSYNPKARGVKFLLWNLKNQAELIYDELNENSKKDEIEIMRKEKPAAVLECEIPEDALFYVGIEPYGYIINSEKLKNLYQNEVTENNDSDKIFDFGFASDKLIVIRELTDKEIFDYE